MADYKEMFSGERGVFRYLQQKLHKAPLLRANLAISATQFREEGVATNLSLTTIFETLVTISEAIGIDDIEQQDCLEHGYKEPLNFIIPDLDILWQIKFGERIYSEIGDMKKIFGDKFADEHTTEFRELFFSWKDREEFENFLRKKVDGDLLAYDKMRKCLVHLATKKTAPLSSFQQEEFCEFIFGKPIREYIGLSELALQMGIEIDKPFDTLKGLGNRVNAIIKEEFGLEKAISVRQKRIFRNY